jgi:hypothetical protein
MSCILANLHRSPRRTTHSSIGHRADGGDDLPGQALHLRRDIAARPQIQEREPAADFEIITPNRRLLIALFLLLGARSGGLPLVEA